MTGDGPTTAAIVRAVDLSCRYAWLLIAVMLLLSLAAATYFVRNFAISSDSNIMNKANLTGRRISLPYRSR